MSLGKKWIGLAAAATSCALLAYGCGGSGDSTSSAPEPLTSQEIIAKAKPATVELFGKVGDDLVGGTGVIYDAENGRIITNAHVIEGVSALQVKIGDTLPTVPARVVGQSPCDDLAVVELAQRPDALQSLPIGDSSTVQGGDDVIALGYPASFQHARQQTVSSTEGSVSNPSVVGNEIGIDLPKYSSLIEHQAPINHGNSGGPLVNTEGEVIGINSLTSAPIGNQGQYYAISSNQVKNLLPTLESGNSPGYVGWSVVPMPLVSDEQLAVDYINSGAYEDLSAATALKFARDDKKKFNGLYVVSSPNGTPANKAKVYHGDLITAVNGTHVETIAELCKILQSQSAGSTLDVETTTLTSSSDPGEYGNTYDLSLKLPPTAVPPPATTSTTTSSSTTSTTSTATSP